MRIEDESMENQFYRDDYLDLELMWLKKIGEVEQETHKIKSINVQEVRAIKRLEEELTKKRVKVAELEGKVEEASHRNQMAAIE